MHQFGLASKVAVTFFLFAKIAFAQAQVNPLVEKPLKDDIRPEDVIHWEAVGGTMNVARTSIEVGLRLTTESNFTVYKDRIKFIGTSGFVSGRIVYPASKTIIDPVEQKQAEVFEGGEFIVTFEGVKALDGENFDIAIEYTGCTEVICLFPHTIQLTVPVSISSPEAVPAATSDAKAADPEGDDGGGINDYFQKLIVSGFTQEGTPFWFVLILIFLGGLVSNLTPCVYPMIPITIRILSNTGHPLWYAFCYGTGIVVTYTGLGCFAGLTGSMFGKFMQNPIVNLSFGIMMVVLALGMLGFGNFGALQTIGSRIGSGKPSARNTFFMGMGAGLVAAPCTGPIMLALLGYAANQGSLMQSILIFLVYSSGFAIPYVVLGASTAKISKRTFSHHIQVAVKVVFAAIMFGLALYYFRIPLYKPLMALDPYWDTIALAAGVIGIGLTGLFVIRPSLENDKRALVIPTIILGFAIFSSYKSFSAVGPGAIQWLHGEDEAFAASTEQNKPIFIDGWAEWCLACIEMDKTTFQDPRVIAELTQHWVLLKLDLTESNDANDKIIEKYAFQGLPSYAMLLSGGKLNGSKILAGKMDAGPLLSELQRFRAGSH